MGFGARQAGWEGWRRACRMHAPRAACRAHRMPELWPQTLLGNLLQRTRLITASATKTRWTGVAACVPEAASTTAGLRRCLLRLFLLLLLLQLHGCWGASRGGRQVSAHPWAVAHLSSLRLVLGCATPPSSSQRPLFRPSRVHQQAQAAARPDLQHGGCIPSGAQYHKMHGDAQKSASWTAGTVMASPCAPHAPAWPPPAQSTRAAQEKSLRVYSRVASPAHVRAVHEAFEAWWVPGGQRRALEQRALPLLAASPPPSAASISGTAALSGSNAEHVTGEYSIK